MKCVFIISELVYTVEIFMYLTLNHWTFIFTSSVLLLLLPPPPITFYCCYCILSSKLQILEHFWDTILSN